MKVVVFVVGYKLLELLVLVLLVTSYSLSAVRQESYKLSNQPITRADNSAFIYMTLS